MFESSLVVVLVESLGFGDCYCYFSDYFFYAFSRSVKASLYSYRLNSLSSGSIFPVFG
nr:MAG TPA: hypothetical protein [Crassvirales sp.]